MIDNYLIWLALVIVFCIVEAATLGLTSIWFACGALAAMVCDLAGGPLWAQIALFAVVSVAALYFIGKKVKGRFNVSRQATNADRIIGQTALVTETIDNMQALGAIQVGGNVWTARSLTDDPIPVGAEVIVRSINGVKAMVEIA